MIHEGVLRVRGKARNGASVLCPGRRHSPVPNLGSTSQPPRGESTAHQSEKKSYCRFPAAIIPGVSRMPHSGTRRERAAFLP